MTSQNDYLPTQPGVLYVSKYLELKAQIEAMQAQLEEVRRGEIDEQVTDIKKKIAAFGITPDMLFSKDALGRPPARPTKVRFADGNGNTWGGRGFKPDWYTKALAEGKTPDDLRVTS